MKYIKLIFEELENHMKILTEMNKKLDTHTELLTQMNEKLDKLNETQLKMIEILEKIEKKLNSSTERRNKQMPHLILYLPNQQLILAFQHTSKEIRLFYSYHR